MMGYDYFVILIGSNVDAVQHFVMQHLYRDHAKFYKFKCIKKARGGNTLWNKVQ